jgi:hypothetical protein
MLMGPNLQTSLALIIVALIVVGPAAPAQSRTYPDKIRGYKVERTVVEIKKPNGGKTNPDKRQNPDVQTAGPVPDNGEVDQLIQLGQPELARVTPLGVTFSVPIVVAPVVQKGHVDFMVFEDMTVNGHSVEVAEYDRSFDLPNKDRLTLNEPLKIYIYLTGAFLAALGEWSDAKETWPVTGRVYVFGKYKKSILGISGSFKRVVPVELNLKMRNPMLTPK